MDFACLRCGYDIEGQLEAGVWECPECGHPIDPIERHGVWAARRVRRRGLTAGIGAPPVGVGLAAVLGWCGLGGGVLVVCAAAVCSTVGFFAVLRVILGRRPVWKHDPMTLGLAVMLAALVTLAASALVIGGLLYFG